MKREHLGVVVAPPPCRSFSSVRRHRRFAGPELRIWSVRQPEPVEITGQPRSDYERELRISALGNLMCSDCATRLWRRVCCYEMCREIRARSEAQLNLLEGARGLQA